MDLLEFKIEVPFGFFSGNNLSRDVTSIKSSFMPAPKPGRFEEGSFQSKDRSAQH
jgi:hypothetical protein